MVESNSFGRNEGRRIVELGHLDKQMRCIDCNKLFHLMNSEPETRRGFDSTLYIMRSLLHARIRSAMCR